MTRLSNDTFCSNVDLNAQTGIDFDSIINDAVVFLDNLGDFNTEGVDNAESAFDTIEQTADNVEQTADNITPQSWQSLIFIVPFSVFAVLFLVGVALAWCEKSVAWYTCMLSWVVLPLFIILIVICFLCSGGIAIAASANAGKTIVVSLSRLCTNM